ncbi:MAG: ATP-binding protein [Alkalinema sp. RU_4_3]|nr:ATP-binding protein [Alkalinema sp. RU_4_3]
MVQPAVRLALEDEIVAQALGSIRFGRLDAYVHPTLGAILEPSNQPLTRVPKITPILQVPPAPQVFIGRHLELAHGIAAIVAHRSMEICGPSGIGKSLFLRQLAHHPQVTTSHPDGILFLTERLVGGDLYQKLFDTFYYTYPDARLSEADLKLVLRDRQALILVDELVDGAETICQLHQLMPQSTLVVATETPLLPALMYTLWLPPLLEEEALQLAERQHCLSVEEQAIVSACWRETQGNPRQLLRRAFLAQRLEGGWSQEIPTTQDLWVSVFEGLMTAEQWIMALLIALEGGGVTSAQIAAITGPQEPGPSLRSVVQSQLVTLRQGRYWLTELPPRDWAQSFKAEAWMERVWAYVLPQMGRPATVQQLADMAWLWAMARWLRRSQRHEDLLQLGRWLSPMLLLTKQWEDWSKLLQWMLQSSWQLQDSQTPGVVSEGWIWQQLAVLAGCREDVTQAYDAYTQALKRYRQGGDLPQAELMARCRQRLMVDMVPTKTAKAGPGKRDTFRVTASRASRRQVNLALGVIGAVTFGVTLVVGLLVQRLWSPEASLDQSPIPVSSPDPQKPQEHRWD